jgi:mRNA-degrading endonuclease RelE of RelBE toxin-antitoxin system
MLWLRTRHFGWLARKAKYRLALEKSLTGLNPAAGTPEEKAAIVAVAEALHVEKFKILHPSEIEKELNFHPQDSTTSGEQFCFPGARPKFRHSPTAPDEQFPMAAPKNLSSGQKEWLLAMPSNFRKCIPKNMDSNLQARVLQAISEICQNPMTPRGDTIAPLTHELRGCWRYRISQFRLLYQPVPERREIILVTFESRGSVYD